MHCTHLPHRYSAAVWTSKQALSASRACRAQASAGKRSRQSLVCSAAVFTGVHQFAARPWFKLPWF